MSYSPENTIPLGSVMFFVESILIKKFFQSAGKQQLQQRQPAFTDDWFLPLTSSRPSYAYALANKVQVRDLETVSETYGSPEVNIPAIKKEIGRRNRVRPK